MGLKARALEGLEPGNLSTRQREVLFWTARGKTTWETAVIMTCTEATVNYHLKQVFRKLQATNKTHALSRALSLGLLDADERFSEFRRTGNSVS